MNDTLPVEIQDDPEQDDRRPVRPQTVVWGFLLFAVAAVFFLWIQLDLNRFNPVVVVTWIVLILGALAVLGGILGAVLHRLRR